ncbi:50S ribosomal protein L11 methyltransferase [bacterium]|nr:50S ribosomal protein L11 methyltransferase [bacterium]
MQLREKTYFELSVKVPSEVSDIVCEIIRDNFNTEGIVTSYQKFKDLECILTDETIKAYIQEDCLNLDEVKALLKEKKQIFEECGLIEKSDNDWEISIKKVENEDWSKTWKSFWKPLKISDKIVICPTWEEYEQNNNEIIINLDPGNAFGTGTHPTTQLCVRAEEKYMQKNSDVADIGTGSGILAICAKKLGAKTAVGVDTDETVEETAKENAKINSIDDIIFKTSDISILESGKYDFVLANILHNVLAQIMPDLKRITKENGFIVLSGILKGKEGVVFEAIERNSLKVLETMTLGDWLAIVVKKEE